MKAPDNIRQFHSEAAAALTQLKKSFIFPMKATLILRNPEDDACDVLVTEDETFEIQNLLERSKEREKAAVKLQ